MVKNMVIYKTNTWNGHGKQNYYWNEYRLENDKVNEYKCHKFKFFDGHENEWDEDETLINSWNIEDSSMPEWLRQYIK